MDFLVILYFGQQEADDPDNLPKVKRFKKKVSEEEDDVKEKVIMTGVKALLGEELD